jgi:hypothetical protein
VEIEERLSWLVGLAERVHAEVRYERLGGDGGGLCVLKGRRILFIDLDADATTRYEATLQAVSGLPNFSDFHIPPVIEEDLARFRAERES